MPLVVETGEGLEGADSYVSVTVANTHHINRGNLSWAGSTESREVALRKATSFIDSTYYDRFPGYRAKRRAQALEWPRVGAYLSHQTQNSRTPFVSTQGFFDFGFDYLPHNTIPREIIFATCEAALREIVEPGSLEPDLERGGGIKSLSAGSVSIEYSGNASPWAVFRSIDLGLRRLLLPSNEYSGRVTRG